MTTKKRAQRRQQVVVYLDERDLALLEEVTHKTGLPKTEVFRRGLKRVADDALAGRTPGLSLAHLIATAREDDLPADVAERHDAYLYGGGYRSKQAK